MDWLDDVRQRVKRKNLVLFTKENALIQTLQQAIDGHNHRTVALWALALAGDAAAGLREKYPDEERPQQAVALSRAWAAGQVKMPVAQRAILNAHAFAREITAPEDIALCHAIGQGCGVVHTKGHGVGFPVYELTALVRRHGVEGCREAVEGRVAEYLERLAYWEQHSGGSQYTWAGFMLKD